MTRPFTFLLLWSVALFFGACSGEDSSATDGDRVPLRPGIHAGATLVSSRTLVNGIGTGADRINSIGSTSQLRMVVSIPVAVPREPPLPKGPATVGAAPRLPMSVSGRQGSMPGHLPP